MDFQEMLFGAENWTFLPEVALRTAVMFILLIIFMNFSGKRSINQLSVFEMVLIIALGSAAGDPMFYKEVGILLALTVLFVTMLIYRGIIFLVTHSEKWENFFEGRAEYLIKDGKLTQTFLDKKKMGIDEFFSELRFNNVEHLGQIRDALLETNGKVSVIYAEDEKVKWGLPIWPEKFLNITENPTPNNIYSCRTCGATESIQNLTCHCENRKVVESLNTKRKS